MMAEAVGTENELARLRAEAHCAQAKVALAAAAESGPRGPHALSRIFEEKLVLLECEERRIRGPQYDGLRQELSVEFGIVHSTLTKMLRRGKKRLEAGEPATTAALEKAAAAKAVKAVKAALENAAAAKAARSEKVLETEATKASAAQMAAALEAAAQKAALEKAASVEAVAAKAALEKAAVVEAVLAKAALEKAAAVKAVAAKAASEKTAAVEAVAAKMAAEKAAAVEAATKRATAAEREVEHLSKRLASERLEPMRTPAERRRPCGAVNLFPGVTMLCQVLPAGVCAAELPALEAVARNAEKIFNPDEKRRQQQVPAAQPAAAAMHEALRRAGELKGREEGGYNVIHSRKGCKQQEWHSDYDPGAVARCCKKPRSAILCLEAGTRLWVIVNGVAVEVQLEVGDILLFDGDVVHAGAAYAYANTRLHVYLDVRGVEHRELDTTYLRKERRLVRS